MESVYTGNRIVGSNPTLSASPELGTDPADFAPAPAEAAMSVRSRSLFDPVKRTSRRRSRIAGRDFRQSCRRLAHGRDECAKADPSPIDAMMGNQTVLDIHDLDQIHLVTLRRPARIFPSQLPAVGKE